MVSWLASDQAILAAIDPSSTTSRLAAAANDLGVANRRRRVACSDRIAKGSGMLTDAMTRSANPSEGLINGRDRICSTISRSASTCSRHARHCARCCCTSGAGAPVRQASISSAER
jgi:hypothetical protein